MLTIYIIENDHKTLIKTIEAVNASRMFKISGTVQTAKEFREHLGEIVTADIMLIDEKFPELDPLTVMSIINFEMVKRPSGVKGVRAVLMDDVTDKNGKKYLDCGYQKVLPKTGPWSGALETLGAIFMEKQNSVQNYDRYVFYRIDLPEFHLYLSEILHEVGIPASLKGYVYLRRAIEIAFLCLDTVAGGITKIIYPAVAEIFNTTPSRVERSMRHAIETGWLRGNVDTIENLFSYSYSSEKGKPTNGEFIANIADHLAVKFRKEQREIVEEIEKETCGSEVNDNKISSTNK